MTRTFELSFWLLATRRRHPNHSELQAILIALKIKLINIMSQLTSPFWALYPDGAS